MQPLDMKIRSGPEVATMGMTYRIEALVAPENLHNSLIFSLKNLWYDSLFGC